MDELVLRPYQQRAIAELRQKFATGHRKLMLYAPTGAGKTQTSADMLKKAYEKGTRAAFVVDRIVLVDQTSRVLDRYGIPHGVIQAGHWRYRPNELIQICSAQTIEARGFFPDTAL
uniref:DEAD/DEAH box helicase family protein n=1 Tax=Ferrovum sp. TaxID=2609467 RepID=UPI0026238FF7